MSTTKPDSANATAAAEPPAVGEPPISPTVTHYQQLAAEVMVALDKIATIIPQLEAAHISAAEFVRTHQSASVKFLATATVSVEQNPELQSVNKLDVVKARDTLQYLDAFLPVLDKLSTFQKKLRFTLKARKADLTSEALQIYEIGKGLARDLKSTALASAVANMKRDYGSRNTQTPLRLRKPTASPGIGVPAPRDRNDSEPRG
jgi:hypothetical protein